MKYRTASPVTVVALAITVIVSLIIAQSHAREDATVVEIDGGKVRGVSSDGLLTFKGIPFARPPAVGAPSLSAMGPQASNPRPKVVTTPWPW